MMVPVYKVEQNVQARNIEDNINNHAKEGFLLIPETFKWDETLRNASYLLIKQTIGQIVKGPIAADDTRGASDDPSRVE